MSDKPETIWQHLDEFRKTLFQMAAVIAIFAIAAFCFKDELFSFILAPHNSDFILYRWFNSLSELTNLPSISVEPFNTQLINIELTAPFMIHMTVALYAGVLIASPIIIFILFRYISPALYTNEKRATLKVLPSAILLFYIGLALNYLIIFPISFHFLATYTVSPLVANQISISSYIDTFVMLSIMMGIAFELPILCWLLGKLGLIKAATLAQYRKHALVVILIIAAIITPTSDIFTLLIVSLPIYMLYEISIIIMRKSQPKDL